MKNKFFFFLVLMLFLSGCKIFQPGVMLRTSKDYKYSDFPDSTSNEYTISSNDYIQFRLYANDGFKLIEFTTDGGSGSNVAQSTGLLFLVEFDGTVKLPLLSHIKLAGKTVREAERYLEKLYSEFYNKPFVMLRVTNRRVIIFPGNEGDAKVVALQNERTTLLEALASGGGISANGKARKIKLIRGEFENRSVFLVDLSTIEGMKQADMVLQANDIIYIEPVFNLSRELLSEISPIISLISSTLLFITVVNTLK